MNAPSVIVEYVKAESSPDVCYNHILYVLKFQGNAGHIRVVPCGPRVFVRARDNLCLMWTEPLTQGAQR